jgi:hypothetical protein
MGQHRLRHEAVAPVGRGAGHYLTRVHGVDGESPTDDGVVINTGRLMPDAAVGLILGLVQACPTLSPPTAESRAPGG